MALSALLLTLAAAVVHASWNLLLSGVKDTHSAAAVATVVGTVLFAPAALLTWRLHAAALPYVLASSGLEGLYLVLLATGYARAAMSFVYPIARGAAPVFVLAVSVVALGLSPSALSVSGVLLVALGICAVHGLRRAENGRELLLALGVAGCIAAYTLVDKHGIRHARPLSYLEIVFALTSSAYLAGTWRIRGGAAIRAAVSVRTVLAGIGFFGSYALVLAALELASAASVAAVRESSVVMATAALAVSGRERITPGRFAGAVAVVAGIALISLS
jgi:drug/metabolite transporter (DMT)-like permease